MSQLTWNSCHGGKSLIVNHIWFLGNAVKITWHSLCKRILHSQPYLIPWECGTDNMDSLWRIILYSQSYLIPWECCTDFVTFLMEKRFYSQPYFIQWECCMDFVTFLMEKCSLQSIIFNYMRMISWHSIWKSILYSQPYLITWECGREYMFFLTEENPL